MSKKTLSTILVVVLVLGCMVVPAMAAEGKTVTYDVLIPSAYGDEYTKFSVSNVVSETKKSKDEVSGWTAFDKTEGYWYDNDDINVFYCNTPTIIAPTTTDVTGMWWWYNNDVSDGGIINNIRLSGKYEPWNDYMIGEITFTTPGIFLIGWGGTSSFGECDYYFYLVVGSDTQATTSPVEKPSIWAEEQVNTAIAANLVPEALQTKYTQATTRAEFCALAVALYENKKGEITERKSFVDTNDINVQKIGALGVVSGVGNDKFVPNGTLTREQAAVILSRLAAVVGKPLPIQAAVFADNTKISSWAVEGVGQVQATGIMSGVGDNKFAPQDPYTREQSIITIMRLYEIIK